MSGRLGRVLRLEDVLLVGWLTLVGPVLMLGAGGEPLFDLDQQSDPGIGLIYLVATIGGLACLLTRGRDEPTVAGEDPEAARGFAPFPLAAALGIVGTTGLEKIGIPDADLMLGVAFLATMISFVALSRLPAVAPEIRRLVMGPYIVVSGGIFQAVMAPMWSSVSWSSFFGPEVDGGPFSPAELFGIFIAGSAVYYVMFVFAPRQLVYREGAGAIWLARFGLFVGGTLFGMGWLRFALG